MKFPLKAFFSVLASAALCVPVFAGEPGGVVRFVDADAVSVAEVGAVSAAQFDASEPAIIAQVGHHAAACGCETYPACGCDVAPAPACGCEPVCAAPSSCAGSGCGHHRHRSILNLLGLHNCRHGQTCCSTPACAEPACGCEVEAACGCETACAAPAYAAPACGCETACAAPACGSSCSGHRQCGHHRSLLDVLFSCKHRGGCCAAPSCCEEPVCGCDVAAPACGCETACAAPTCASSCSGSYGGRHRCCHRPILSLLGLHHCGHGASGCCAEVACAAPVCGVEPNCAADYASPSYAAPVPAVMPMPTIEPTPAAPQIEEGPPAPPASPSDQPGGADVSSSRSKWYSVK